ncbi:MAG: glycosyltransferase family 4 protein [Paludibacter sp.]|jgi:glycosyltransferase involved in cell wall biosynthesis|nr:glycosyltransferase family 4 protein [Paludibacter sp.]
MQRKIKIGFLSAFDIFNDRKSYSGSNYKLREAIEQAGYDVTWIKFNDTSVIIKLLKKVLFFITRRIQGKDLIISHTRLIGKIIANTVDKQQMQQCDFIFASGGTPITVIAALKYPKPLIYCVDGTFHSMIDFYFHNLAAWNIRSGNYLETQVYKKANIVLHSSRWASDDAINFYKTDRKKCHIIEFGATLDEKDIVETKIYCKNETLNIFFSGVEWERKGADIAIDTVIKLNEKGIKAKLFLTGIAAETIPENYQNNKYVEYSGFLNKNIPKQYRQYIDIIKQSHIFLLPTKAECAGIVFCEASAYGLPIFTYDVGGVANYVINGVNGYRLQITERGDDFCKKIIDSINNNELPKLKEGGLKLYKERLNWNVWSKKFKTIVK